MNNDQIKELFLTPLADKKVSVIANRAFKTTSQCLILRKKLQGVLDKKEINEPLSIYNRYRYFIE